MTKIQKNNETINFPLYLIILAHDYQKPQNKVARDIQRAKSYSSHQINFYHLGLIDITPTAYFPNPPDRAENKKKTTSYIQRTMKKIAPAERIPTYHRGRRRKKKRGKENERRAAADPDSQASEVRKRHWHIVASALAPGAKCYTLTYRSHSYTI